MKITKRQLQRIIKEASFMGPARLEGLIKRYNDAGRVAHHYKRRGTIALDGMRPMKIKDAIEKMERVLNPPTNEGAQKIRITRRQLRRIIREAYSGAPGPFPERYGDAHERYVLERSGVGWGEKFFVEIGGRNAVVWGPLENAQKFRDTPSAEKVQKEIDRLEGLYTQIQPASFFE